MKKLLLALFVLVVAAAMGHGAYVEITFPNGGEKLTLKNSATITWIYSGTIDSALVKLVLFKGGTDAAHKVGNIVQNIPIRITSMHGAYTWQVGGYDGGFAGVGSDYYIKIISMNGDFSDFSNNPFSIVLPKIPFEKLHREWVELDPDPGCPMCGVFNLEDLLARLGNRLPPIGRLVILRNGRQVGQLGVLSGGLLLNRMSKLRFAVEDFALLGQENQGFEVAILDVLRPNVLKRQALFLKMKQ